VGRRVASVRRAGGGHARAFPARSRSTRGALPELGRTRRSGRAPRIRQFS
jgi:hypothetical protein